MADTYRFKICLLGEGRVGKTSILVRYVKSSFDPKQISTVQASYMDKVITVGDKTVKLSVWDTAGQERFHALGPLYYRDADACLLVYDITDAESFDRVKHWVKELRKIVGNNVVIAIAGNKVDMESSRQVNQEEASKYAESVGATHFHTSAKLDKGLDKVFLHLVQALLEKQPAGDARKPAKKQLVVAEEDERPRKKEGSGGSGGGGCC